MFARSKHFGIRMVVFFSIGVIVSFILSIIAAYVQDNTVGRYNVMGITMPPWFYFILAMNAIVFLFGAGNGVAAAYSFFIEANSARGDISDIPEVEQQESVVFTDTSTSDIPVYDPQRALTR